MAQFRIRRLTPSRLLALGSLVVLGGCASTGALDPRASPSMGTSPDPETTTAESAASVSAAPPPVQAPPPARPAATGVASNSIVVTNPLAPRTLDLTRHQDDIWDRVRNGFAIPNIDTPLVAEQQARFLAHPEYLRRAVDRSSLYLYHVVEELNKRGMPTEIALLPFVESAYNPMAYSRAHASGMWQFIPGTGKEYNLKQDWWRDERRDVLASTDAALTYLGVIYEMHGDWHLALASYNWGEGSVKRAIERNQAAGLPTDYLSLPMPDETRNYVPKLQALKNIIANPEAFGVTLPKIDNEPYFVAVERSRDIDIRTAARLANMTLEDFKALNPSFNRPVIRGSSNTALLVPADRAADFENGLANQGPLATWQAHTVGRKETLERIAATYGMTVAALREVNGLGANGKVRPGQGLLVLRRGEGDVALRYASFNPPDNGAAFALPSTSAVSVYQVKRGDTLTSLAKRFGVAPDELRSTNRMKGTQVLLGQQLQIPRTAATKVAKVSASAGRGPSPTTAATAPGPVAGKAAAKKPTEARR